MLVLVKDFLAQEKAHVCVVNMYSFIDRKTFQSVSQTIITNEDKKLLTKD